MELSSVAPKLAKRASTGTSEGFKLVCDRILATVINIADQGVSAARESDPTVPFGHFRAIGVLKCENQNCFWKVPEDMMPLPGQDPGPEFTLAKRDGGWYAVCSSCGSIAMGPMDEEDAKDLAASVRFDLWAPETLAYGGGEMEGSSFLELLAEEMELRRGAKRDFSPEELKGMLGARSKFASKVEAALKSGSLTSEQRDELLTLNRKHSLPGG